MGLGIRDSCTLTHEIEVWNGDFLEVESRHVHGQAPMKNKN